ncbi:MAG: sugar phosphate isomerase/epimerase family protein [Candidatus Hydrogenedentes bacterium]|nr:sugar phosphate isomerase/epimerase family protein [Candidatus Hydrogenedentota bacterium]
MKFGICSEIFKDWNDVGRAIDYVKSIGYDGLEIAPFTLAQYVTEIPASKRRDIATRAEQAGLDILGIHWVLVGPEGLYLTHPDKSVRDRTAQYLVDLAHFCGDVGGQIMVFGSPKQRNILDGVSYQQAFDYATEVFETAMPTFAGRDVTLCMEPLASTETNFMKSAAETVTLIERIAHPNFQLLLDTKAMTGEPDGRPATIRKHAKYLKHYHANDANLEGPGFGDVDFAPIFDALRDINFSGYASVEVFKFDPGPETIATKSLDYMKRFVS